MYMYVFICAHLTIHLLERLVRLAVSVCCTDTNTDTDTYTDIDTDTDSDTDTDMNTDTDTDMDTERHTHTHLAERQHVIRDSSIFLIHPNACFHIGSCLVLKD